MPTIITIIIIIIIIIIRDLAVTCCRPVASCWTVSLMSARAAAAVHPLPLPALLLSHTVYSH